MGARESEVVGMLEANDVASVILTRSGPWTDAMKLQKLLYYVQAWHLAVTDEPLFDERIKAWKDGPVVPQVWHDRREQATRRSTNQHLGGIELPEFASNLIDLVIAKYGSMSGEELSALTHVEEPWLEARGGLPEDAVCQTAISCETMARFYRTHRQLDGYTAADLAAGGIPRRHTDEPLDIDAILAQLGVADDLDEDLWGGANLIPSLVDDLTDPAPRRADHADA